MSDLDVSAIPAAFWDALPPPLPDVIPDCAVVPARLVETLVHSRHMIRRYGVASWVRCPPELLAKLAGDVDVLVREQVVGNPSCPPEVLDELSRSDDEAVVMVAAANRRCPQEILARLAFHDDVSVRMAVACNPICPETSLAVLRADADVAVCWRANMPRPPYDRDSFEFMARDSDERVRARPAGEPACPAEILERLAADPEPHVRGHAAQNPACPAVLLERLARDVAWDVHWYAARNPACPVEALEAMLAAGEDPTVCAGAALNPALDAGVLGDVPLGRFERGDALWVALKAVVSRTAPGRQDFEDPAFWEAAAVLLSGGFGGTPTELLCAARTVVA